MEVGKVINLIEKFAPPELQENWDCSGIQIDGNCNVKKILLALSVTEDIVNQAVEKKCDMIVSHHPLFFIPFTYNKNIPIYSAHTNLDKADGGTTDTLIELLGFDVSSKIGDFLRVVELHGEMPLGDFINLIKSKLNLNAVKVVNNYSKKTIKKLAFCAGSGSDFLGEAQSIKADILITGDVKYHCALDSDIIIVDVGHFESEHPVLNTVKELLETLNIEVIIADEKSPFINY